ncbi:spore Coat Protein U domain protein [Janthinobacterium agaricidamnosum NBRC 102515 = DSM 9628]|uniref:Spore Coat Protein U domain protein n=2 Tax=Janthinobacterium agaricidamnosum TaxID=55508 RepID=W0V9Z3_9BURK|nr:spore Coat Protein U domain protein [Janthinobacterium agaricidamnosum NBRC 102515 = DSM 9628]
MLLMMTISDAKADICSASMTDISFGNVSPVSGQDYFANGTLSITCTFIILDGNIIILPNINVCANLDPGPGAIDINSRVLTNGTKKIPFNLYRTATYTPANVWGGYATTSSINTLFSGLLAIGTNTLTFPVYARISASDLALAATESNATTTYATNFTGAGTINYTSGSIIVRPCQTSGTTASFGFNVRANIINDCLINTTPVAFGSRGVLSGGIRATGNVTVKCTVANSYRIVLSGGNVTNAQNDRRMKNALSNETVSYRLSSSLDGPIWGDGTAGTTTYDNVGTGASQQVTIYGLIPSQTTPSPGDYSDKVTATVYF